MRRLLALPLAVAAAVAIAAPASAWKPFPMCFKTAEFGTICVPPSPAG